MLRNILSILPIGLFLFLAAGPLQGAEETPQPLLETLQKAHAGVRRFTLENGMICLVKEDRAAPIVSIQIWIKSGAIHEEEFLGGGLSHFIEHMIFKGTPTRKPGDISREISDAGGDINAYTAQDRTVFHSTLPARHWTTGLEVLADAVMNASFPEEEYQREQEVILREMAMSDDDPGRVLGKLLWQTAYRVHPYRHPIIGYKDVFRSMTLDNLRAFFRRNYSPDNMIVAVVGDLRASEAEESLRAAFSNFARRARAPSVLPAEPPQVAPRFARKTGAYEVSRLASVYHTVGLSHPDTAALDVLAAIVGHGRSARLTEAIKEQQQLALDIGAWSHTPEDPGLFGITATFAPEREQALLDAIEEQVAQWAGAPFSAEEIEKARRNVMVGALSALQDMSGQAYSYASGEFYAGDPFFTEQYIQRVMEVSPDRLREVVEKYLRPENRTLVILSPAAGDEPAGTNETTTAPLTLQTLPNGLRLIVREDHRLPFVYACIALRGGLLSETSTDNGITQLMSDLLTRGTPARSAAQIALQVEQLGASLSAFCGRNSFGLQASSLSQDAATLLDILADCLLNAGFPPEELEKQRAIQLASLQQQREQPFFIADESLRKTLFPGHPYQWDTSGSPETVAGISRKDLQAHLNRLVSVSNAVLALFGDITAEQARALAGQYFAPLPQRPKPVFASPLPKPVLPARVKHREPRQQTVLLMGYPGVDLRDPRMDALALLSESLSGLSSDLAIEVRDKRGLVYYVGAFNRPGMDPGLFGLYAGAREDTVREVEDLMMGELERIAREGLRQEEFRRARDQLITAQEASLQSNAGLAQTSALDELYGLGYLHTFHMKDRLNKLTPEDVRAVAGELFVPGRRAVSIVFPEETPTQKETPDE